MNASPPWSAGPVGRREFDLAQVPVVRSGLRSRAFPAVAQVMLLGVFVGLMVLAWGERAPAGVPAKLFAKSHLATLLVWGLWWPAMVWGAVWFGRVWCMVCPLEWVATQGERLARLLAWPTRPLPRWLATGGLVVALYAGIQLLVAGVQLHRVPAYTAYFLAGLLGTAGATGLWFRQRAFCRGFCPVGLLLGTYGRGGMLAVRPGRAPVEPVRPVGARECPSLLNPSRLASNEACLMCTACFKAAAPGELRLVVRRPFPAEDRRVALAPWPVAVFVAVVSGFVLGELCTEWPAAEHAFLAAPRAVTAALGWPAAGGWIDGLWALAVVPAVLWSGLVALARGTGATGSSGEILRRLAWPMAVLVSAGHLAKGLAKFVSWGPFWSRAVADPHGADSARALAAKLAPMPASWLPITVVGAVGLGLIAGGYWLAVREYRLAARDTATEAAGFRLPAALVAVLFFGLVGGWVFR